MHEYRTYKLPLISCLRLALNSSHNSLHFK